MFHWYVSTIAIHLFVYPGFLLFALLASGKLNIIVSSAAFAFVPATGMIVNAHASVRTNASNAHNNVLFVFVIFFLLFSKVRDLFYYLIRTHFAATTYQPALCHAMRAVGEAALWGGALLKR